MTSSGPSSLSWGSGMPSCPKGYEPPPGWTRLARGRGADLLENGQALPRAFVPSSIYYEPDHARRLAALRVITDYRAWGVVGSKPPSTSSQATENGPGRVTVVAYRPQSMTLEIEAERDTIVGTSVTAWPGWKARLDGFAAEPLSYNHAFLAFRVPVGRHRLELRYRPDSFTTGAAISLATLAVLLFAALRSTRTRSPRTSTTMPA